MASPVRLLAACQHPGLELLGPKAAVAGHHGGSYRLDHDVKVLAHASTVRPQTHVRLLRRAECLHDAGRVAQHRAEFRRSGVIEVTDSHDVLPGPTTSVPRFIGPVTWFTVHDAVW